MERQFPRLAFFQESSRKEPLRSSAMGKTSRFGIVLMVAAAFAGTISFAQTGGEAVYKAKCQSCHGAQGVPNPGIAKNMGVKPASDPAVKSMTAAQMITVTTAGKGKMPAFKGKLTDAQIKDSVDYFRTFAK
jgi:mono/diheme cytochrome c family protein